MRQNKSTNRILSIVLSLMLTMALFVVDAHVVMGANYERIYFVEQDFQDDANTAFTQLVNSNGGVTAEIEGSENKVLRFKSNGTKTSFWTNNSAVTSIPEGEYTIEFDVKAINPTSGIDVFVKIDEDAVFAPYGYLLRFTYSNFRNADDWSVDNRWYTYKITVNAKDLRADGVVSGSMPYGKFSVKRALKGTEDWETVVPNYGYSAVTKAICDQTPSRRVAYRLMLNEEKSTASCNTDSGISFGSHVTSVSEYSFVDTEYLIDNIKTSYFEDENSKSRILVGEDFEGEKRNFAGGNCSVVKDENTGNSYLRFYQATAETHSGYNYGGSAQVKIANMPDHFALKADIYQESDNTEDFCFEYFSDDKDGDGIADCRGNMVVKHTDVPVGRWYTLEANKIRGTGNAAVFKATLTDHETGESIMTIPSYAYNISGADGCNRVIFRSRNTAGSVMHWRIDNVELTKNFDFELPSRIVEVDECYEGENFCKDGLWWTPVEGVRGTVDDKTTSSKADDEYIDVVVTPTAYLNEDGNVLATTKDERYLSTNTPYGACLYAKNNPGTEIDASKFTDSHDFEMRLKYNNSFYLMYYTGTHRFYMVLGSESLISYNNKNDVATAVAADMQFGEWMDLKLSVRDRKWGTISINGREVVTYELPKATKDSPVLQLALYKIGYPINVEVESVKLTPYDTQSFYIDTINHRDTYAEGQAITLKTNLSGESCQATYYINGVMAGKDELKSETTNNGGCEGGTTTTTTNNGLNISGLKSGVYDIVAEANGAKTFEKRIFVGTEGENPVESSASNGEREYIIEYDYENTSTGNISVNDGYFTLDFTHKGNVIEYRELNNDNAVYTGMANGLGSGKYKIVVTSGYAEVYYNNQFVFSTFLPYTYNEDSNQSFDYSGVENVTKSPSGVKKERYHLDWNGREEIADYGMDFGKYYSVEFDKLDDSNETMLVYDGEYQAKLVFDERGITAEIQREDYDVTREFRMAEAVEPGYYRLTVAKGLAQLFLNNEFVNSFRCPAVSHKKSVFRKIDNPNGTTFVAIKDTDDIYFHSEDFEGRSELDALEYWSSEREGFLLAEGQEDPFTQEIVTENGNSYLKIRDVGLAETITPATDKDADVVGDLNLNVSADNPTFRWRAKADGTGRIHFMGRHMQKGIFLSFGYDFESSQWIFAQRNKMSDSGTAYEGETILASNSGSLDTNWHSYELVMNEGDVKLLCDGAAVLEYSGLKNAHGKLGFGVSKGATLCIDDVEYSGEGKVAAGFSYISTNREGSKDFYYSPKYEGVIACIGYGTSYITKDNGKTWETIKYNSGSMSLNLLSGGYMYVNYKTKRTFAAYYPAKAYENWGSAYHMINGTWNQENLMIEPQWFEDADYGLSLMSGRLVQVQDGKYKGRIFMSRDATVSEAHGKPLLFYTDADIYYDPDDTSYYDGTRAKTATDKLYPVEWTQSETSFFYGDSDINGQEPLVVDMPNDVIRFFVRNDRGFLSYAESYDGGANFGEFKPSQLIAPLCCYGIMRDPQNLNHYYAYFEYEANTSDREKEGRWPRTRTALAVSYDGMANWHYVMDVEELYDSWKSSYQPMNLSMRVVNGTVYMSYRANTAEGKIFTVDTSKIKPLLRFSEVHDRENFYINVPDTIINESCVIPKRDGVGTIYGKSEYVTTEDGKYDGNIIGKIFGMTQKQSGVFHLCGAEILVPADENGKYRIEDAAKLFSVNLIETENAYIISKEQLSLANIHQLEGMGIEKSFDEEIKSDFLNLLNVASKHGLTENVKRHIEENREYISTYSDDLPYEVYSRLTGMKFYHIKDLENAIAMASDAEKGAETKLLTSTNGGFENWVAHSSANSVSVQVNDGVAHISSKGLFDSGNTFGTKAFDAPDGESYVVNFDLKMPADEKVTMNWGGKEHSASVTFGTTDDAAVVINPEVWTNAVILVSKNGGVKTAEIRLTEEGQDENTRTVTIDALEGTGNSGFEVAFPENGEHSLFMKNMRVYTGRTLDLVSYSVNEGKISATVEFLNDGTAFSGGQLFVSVYNRGKLEKIVAVENEDVTEVQGYGKKTIEVRDIETTGKTKEDISLKFYFWDGFDNLSPVTEPCVNY